jgi:hypothetical protein
MPIHHCPVHGVERCFAHQNSTPQRERHWCSGGRAGIVWIEENPKYNKSTELSALVRDIQRTLRSVAGKPRPLSQETCIQ